MRPSTVHASVSTDLDTMAAHQLLVTAPVVACLSVMIGNAGKISRRRARKRRGRFRRGWVKTRDRVGRVRGIQSRCKSLNYLLCFALSGFPLRCPAASLRFLRQEKIHRALKRLAQHNKLPRSCKYAANATRQHCRIEFASTGFVHVWRQQYLISRRRIFQAIGCAFAGFKIILSNVSLSAPKAARFAARTAPGPKHVSAPLATSQVRPASLANVRPVAAYRGQARCGAS